MTNKKINNSVINGNAYELMLFSSYAICNAYNFKGEDEKNLERYLNHTFRNESEECKKYLLKKSYVYRVNDSIVFAMDGDIKNIVLVMLSKHWDEKDRESEKAIAIRKVISRIARISPKKFGADYEGEFDVAGKIKIEKIGCAELLRQRFTKVYRSFFGEKQSDVASTNE